MLDEKHDIKQFKFCDFGNDETRCNGYEEVFPCCFDMANAWYLFLHEFDTSQYIEQSLRIEVHDILRSLGHSIGSLTSIKDAPRETKQVYMALVRHFVGVKSGRETFKRRFYDMGYERGYGLAWSCEIDDERFYDDEYDGEYDIDKIVESLSDIESNDRSFSPFEFTARDINDAVARTGLDLWEEFDNGITEGMNVALIRRGVIPDNAETES